MNIQVESTLVDARTVYALNYRGRRIGFEILAARHSDAPKIAAGVPLIGLRVSLIEIRGTAAAQSIAKFDTLSRAEEISRLVGAENRSLSRRRARYSSSFFFSCFRSSPLLVSPRTDVGMSVALFVHGQMSLAQSDVALTRDSVP